MPEKSVQATFYELLFQTKKTLCQIFPDKETRCARQLKSYVKCNLNEETHMPEFLKAFQDSGK
jgi:hypothetical protein